MVSGSVKLIFFKTALVNRLKSNNFGKEISSCFPLSRTRLGVWADTPGQGAKLTGTIDSASALYTTHYCCSLFKQLGPLTLLQMSYNFASQVSKKNQSTRGRFGVTVLQDEPLTPLLY